MFQITMGVPEMLDFWNELKQKVREGNATKKEQQLFRKLGKTMNHLAHDPFILSLTLTHHRRS